MRVTHVDTDLYIFEDIVSPHIPYTVSKSALQRLSNFLLKVDRRLTSRGSTSLTWSDHLLMRDKLRDQSCDGDV